MKRVLLSSLIAVALILVVLSSCTQPQPYGTIKGVREIYTLGEQVKVEWYIVEYEDVEMPYELVITNPASESTTITLSESYYEFTPDKPGKWTLELYGGKDEEKKLLDEVSFYVTSLEIVKPEDGALFGGPSWDRTVTFEWKELSGASLEYEYAIDDITTAQATSATGVTINGIPDGVHTFYLKIKGIDMPWLTREFRVDTTSPSFIFTGASREHQYLINGDFDPNGRYVYFTWWANENVSTLLLRFYMYDENGTRYRLNLVDSNGDGTYDSWQVLSDASYTEHKWYVLVTDPRYWIMIISDKEMYIPGYDVDPVTGAMTPIGFTKVGFPMDGGKTKGMVGFLAYDEAGNESWYPFTFVLNERYASEDTPQITWRYKIDEEASKLYLGIIAPNLKDYLSSEEHSSSYTDKDTSFAKGLLYLQIPVFYSTNLTLESVEWSNFWAGKKELNYYKVDDSASVTSYTGGNVVYLYKGIVEGEDEVEPVEDTVIATLVFDMDTTEGAEANVGIWYEYDFAQYPNFRDVPNVIVVDELGRQIDGIVVNNSLVGVPLEGGEVK